LYKFIRMSARIAVGIRRLRSAICFFATRRTSTSNCRLASKDISFESFISWRKVCDSIKLSKASPIRSITLVITMDVINLIEECMELDYEISIGIGQIQAMFNFDVPYGSMRYWGQPVSDNNLRYDEYLGMTRYIMDLFKRLDTKLSRLQELSVLENDKRGLSFVNRLQKSLETHRNAESKLGMIQLHKQFLVAWEANGNHLRP
jgi:hypothetical protein